MKKTITITPAAENLTGFASDITGAGPWTTFNATTDGLSRQVSIKNDSATNYAGQTFTIVGKTADGFTATEAVTGPAGSATVESTIYVKTITSITASGAGISTDTMDIGWVDEVATKIYPLNRYSIEGATAHVDITGTANYTLQVCFNNILNGTEPSWISDTTFTGKTADFAGVLIRGATGVRFITSSYSTGLVVNMHLSQDFM